jgi:NitT/TauT family transport system substrate-binding protein
MGCIVARESFINANSELISSFLDEYKASIEYISNPANIDSAANYVVETGVMGAVPAAKSALKNLSGAIAYIDGKDMKAALVAFYKAIGIAEPTKNTFYYAK